MRPAPGDPTLAPWRELQERLAGYFEARAPGLLAAEFVLSDRSGEKFGWLRVHGPEGAELKVGSMSAEIERAARSRYRVLTGGAETLAVEPARNTSGTLEVRCGNRVYEIRLNLLRNTAVARSPGAEAAARIAGGLSNRSYKAVFDVGEEGSLPVALFLLYHTIALRRRAFLAGARGSYELVGGPSVPDQVEGGTVHEEQNYGRSREPGVAAGDPSDGAGPAGSTMSPQDERRWSILAHLSVLAGLVGLMPLGALIIWLIYKDRSPRVGFHALQALWYQIAWLVILVVGWFATFILSFVLIGLLFIPVMLIASLVPLVYGCYAAYKVSQGVDYRYPLIADRIDGGARRML
jgi:uncharacterized protein